MRKLPSEWKRAPQPRSRNRQPLDELERALNLLRHRPPGGNATTRGSVFLSSSPSASPRSRPLLMVLGGCQGIFPALTTTQNHYTQYGIGVMQMPKRAQEA